MDARELRQVTDNATRVAEEHWSRTDAPERALFLELAASYQASRAELKRLKGEKQSCARQFRGADDALQQQLREQMQTISAANDAVEARLKETGTRIAELLAAPDDSSDDDRAAVFVFWQHPDNADRAPDFEVEVSTTADPHWNGYIDKHPGGHFYLRGDVVTEVAALGGHTPSFITARHNDGTLCGVLPLVEMRSRLFGHFAVAVPYFNYGGAIGDNPVIEAALIEAASALLDRGCEHVELRDTRQRPGLPARTDKVSMLLSLPDSRDDLFEGFTAKLRAQIRRPQRERLIYRNGGSELLGDFYRVFAEHMRDLGTPVYPRRLFGLLLEKHPSNCSLHLLYQDEQPVAAAFLLRDGAMMQIPWAATLRRVHDISANMLLYWEVLGYSVESGCAWFDFGRSTKDAGTYRFKRQWGAEPVPHYWHYCLPDDAQLPAINPDNPKYRALIAVWKRLPVWVTKLLGPRIVMNIP